MSVAKDLIAAVRDLQAVRSSNAAVRYGRRRQGDSLPAVTLLRVGTSREYHLENELDSAFITYEFSTYATNEKQLDEIDGAIRNRFSGLTTQTVGATRILSAQIVGEVEIDEPPIGADDRTLLQRSTDYRFNIETTPPTHGS